MIIKVLEKTRGCFPMVFESGDWADLFTAEDIKLKAPEAHKMHIRNKSKENVPEVRTREDEDIWMLPVVATRNVIIPKGTRLAQFRVQLSQKATRWQKIKWLFSGKPKLKPVTELHNPKRGGIGEGTGV